MNETKIAKYASAVASIFFEHLSTGANIDTILASGIGGISRASYYRIQKLWPEIHSAGVSQAEERWKKRLELLDAQTVAVEATRRESANLAQRRLNEAAMDAIQALHNLVRNGRSERTRMEAARTLLDTMHRGIVMPPAPKPQPPPPPQEEQPAGLLPRGMLLPMPMPNGMDADLTIRGPDGQVLRFTQTTELDRVVDVTPREPGTDQPGGQTPD